MQMARKRINMKKIREIIRFSETTDMSERKIARALNISRPVVTQYIKDFNASGLTYEQIIMLRVILSYVATVP